MKLKMSNGVAQWKSMRRELSVVNLNKEDNVPLEMYGRNYRRVVSKLIKKIKVHEQPA